MKLYPILDTNFKIGDVIFTKTNWYVDWFCNFFNIPYSHVSICIDEKSVIQISKHNQVEILDIKRLIKDGKYEAFRQNVSLKKLELDDMMELHMFTYSRITIIKTGLKMLKLIKCGCKSKYGHTCITFANEVWRRMGVYNSADTPTELEKMKVR